MGAPPTPVTAVDPLGIAMKDGYQTRIVFGADPDCSIWPKTVQPPGLDNGDPIQTTTMLNTLRRTKRSRALNEATDMSGTCAYDPLVQSQLEAIVGVEGPNSVYYHDGSVSTFYGYLKSFEPQACEEGSQPEANFTVVETDVDPSDGSEHLPVFTYAGT